MVSLFLLLVSLNLVCQASRFDINNLEAKYKARVSGLMQQLAQKLDEPIPVFYTHAERVAAVEKVVKAPNWNRDKAHLILLETLNSSTGTRDNDLLSRLCDRSYKADDSHDFIKECLRSPYHHNFAVLERYVEKHGVFNVITASDEIMDGLKNINSRTEVNNLYTMFRSLLLKDEEPLDSPFILLHSETINVMIVKLRYLAEVDSKKLCERLIGGGVKHAEFVKELHRMAGKGSFDVKEVEKWLATQAEWAQKAYQCLSDAFNFEAPMVKEMNVPIESVIPVHPTAYAVWMEGYLKPLLENNGHRAIMNAMKESEKYPKESFFFIAMFDGKAFSKNSLLVAYAFPDTFSEENKYRWWLYHFQRICTAKRVEKLNPPVAKSDEVLGFKCQPKQDDLVSSLVNWFTSLKF